MMLPRIQRTLLAGVAIAFGLWLLFPATSALAEGGLGLRGWGVRGGLSSDPEQFVLGMHVKLGEFAENLRFTPNADIGFGDHRTVFTLNPDVIYALPLPEAGTLYFGGTLGFTFVRWDSDRVVITDEGERVKLDNTDSDVGVAGVIGYEPPLEDLPIFFDLKVGISDKYPDLKIMAGYNFDLP